MFMKKLSIITTIICLLAFPSLAANVPTAYLAVVRIGGYPTPNTPAEDMFKTVCEIVPDSAGARARIGEIWNKFAPRFDYKDWEYGVPDAAFYKILIYYEGHFLKLNSVTPELKVDIKDAEFNKKKDAFNELIRECKAWKETPVVP